MPKTVPTLQDIEFICHGYSAFDFNILTSETLKSNHKHSAISQTYNGGGVAPNIAVAAARLGIKVGFSGFISTDPLGQVQYQDLVKEGINMELVGRGSSPSPIAIIIGQPDGETTLIGKLIDQPPGPPINTCPVKPKVILLDGHQRERSLEWLVLAKKIGATTVLDAGYFKPNTLFLSNKVDIVISSREFAEKYCKTTNIEAITDTISTLCNRFIVTLDNQGTAWNWEGEKGVMKAWTVECIDGVGAGDAFHGAFCAGLLNQLSLKDNLLFSSAAGAICCTGLGARQSLPDMNTVQHFMTGQPSPLLSTL